MEWTREEFEQSARALVETLQQEENFVPPIKEGPSTTTERDRSGKRGPCTCFRLFNWQIEIHQIHNCSILYFVHPPIDLMSVTTTTDDALNHPLVQLKDDDDNDAIWLEDDTIQVDHDCIVTSQTNATNPNEDPTFTTKTVMSQWRFSIVYSDTWSVPLLYFTVQWSDTGSPCQRSQVLELLGHNNGGNDTTGDDDTSWDFISQEEHPITGHPSYFLHPCQTSARIALIMSDDIYATAGKLYKSDGNILWTWMSMILPAVNQSIPPKYFQKVQSAIVAKRKREQS